MKYLINYFILINDALKHTTGIHVRLNKLYYHSAFHLFLLFKTVAAEWQVWLRLQLTGRYHQTEPCWAEGVRGCGLLFTRDTTSPHPVTTLTQGPGILGPYGHMRPQPCVSGNPLENTRVLRNVHTHAHTRALCQSVLDGLRKSQIHTKMGPEGPLEPDPDSLSSDRLDQPGTPSPLVWTH